MICPLCDTESPSVDDMYGYHILCLVNFKEKVYELFGYHREADKKFIYEEIPRLRQLARFRIN